MPFGFDFTDLARLDNQQARVCLPRTGITVYAAKPCCCYSYCFSSSSSLWVLGINSGPQAICDKQFADRVTTSLAFRCYQKSFWKGKSVFKYNALSRNTLDPRGSPRRESLGISFQVCPVPNEFWLPTLSKGITFPYPTTPRCLPLCGEGDRKILLAKTSFKISRTTDH